MSNGYLDQSALDALDEVTGGDFEFFVELVETFLEDAPLLINDLEQAIATSNISEVRRLAHSLKGNGREFGATKFASLCETLEHHAAEENLDDATALFQDIQKEFPNVRDALQAYISD